ncbi:helicase associated domain-containing protein [Streptomyces rubradiris]|uniref:helicase associated domain-containing protein n=1 Tax=Streptomyces rubradiris TaxID=285531 RepID=UPI0036EEB608
MKKVGIDFSDRRDAAWRNTYHILKEFHTQHGHCDVPKDLVTSDGINIQSWKRSQRSSYKSNTLRAEYRELLDSIGFSWDPAQDRWNLRCKELAQFHAVHGHFNIPAGPLRSWLYQQRKKLTAGKLSEGAQQRLSDIDPLWAQTDREQS